MKPKLTVLLGAGSTVLLDRNHPHLGMPSTLQLTERIARMRYPRAIVAGTPFVQTAEQNTAIVTPQAISAIGLIYGGLLSTFESVNFELVLHAIEQLLPLANMRDGAASSDQFHPVNAAFMELMRRYEILNDWSLLSVARQKVIVEIRQEIQRRSVSLPKVLPLHEFISALNGEFRLAVFTLNYDDVVDNAYGNWFDGFSWQNEAGKSGTNCEAARFDSASFDSWREATEPVLVHLHGSVRFGPSRQDFGLVKYRTEAEAGQAVEAVSGSVKTSGGQVVEPDPIISGLNKAARLTLNPCPYGYYYRALIDSLLSTERLLVIGYGARDEHIDTWLTQYATRHQSRRRIGWIGALTRKMVGEHTSEKHQISLLSGNSFRDCQHNDARDDPHKLLDLGQMRLGVSGFPITEHAQREMISHLSG